MLIDTIVAWWSRHTLTQGVVTNDQLSHINCQINDKTIPFYYRQDSSGDCGVIEQIFKNEDYKIDMWPQGKVLIEYYRDKIAPGKKALIIDAGANIGASVVYFASQYPQALIYAIEPEKNNHTILKLNSKHLNVKTFEGAVGCEDGQLYLQDPGLSDWGFRVLEEGATPVAVISPDTVLKEVNGIDLFPLIFKIDIEGGEENLFKKNIEWMNLFPLIIIELHDWMLPFKGSSKNFIKAIADRDFDVLHIGENIFCFNRQLLSN